MMPAPDKEKLGECRSLTVTCLSETGWHDNDLMLADIKASDGPDASQWTKSWHADNAAGSASLLEVTLLDGQRRKLLIDCGWNTTYMTRRFEDTGVARMLEYGEVDLLFLSHEHLDHLWGLQAVLRYRPDITICVPATFSDTAHAFIRGEHPSPTGSDAQALIRHAGRIVTTPVGVPVPLYPSCVAVAFDLPVLLGIRGEQSLYFRVRDSGTVCVTGCCHQTVTTLADYAVEHISMERTLYGLYGGLHIAPFGALTAKQEEMIKDMHRFGFRKIAANHCTGPAAIRKMIQLGYPIVYGSNGRDSSGTLTLGNGDGVVFE